MDGGEERIRRDAEGSGPLRLHSLEEMLALVDGIGFLPLFRCAVPGFSVEEGTCASAWWTGAEQTDPWEWRRLAAESGRVAYGKFFGRKAGFISLAWLPEFANWRRDGYDFEARWEDAKAPWRHKKIMDLLADGGEMFSFDLKRRAGFGPDGEKNFEGAVTELMMQTYLVIRDFRCRLNRRLEPYGWHAAVYTTPEALWGPDAVSAAGGRTPSASRERIFARVRERFPGASDAQIRQVLKF